MSLYVESGYVSNYTIDTVTIDWENKIIFIPKTYLTATLNPYIFNLDTDLFRLTLKNLEASEIGMTYLDTHQHNTEVPLGGVIYARVIEIINGYTITFENDKYAVNLFGSNNNIGDVVNLNQVSVRTNNAAGLIVDPSIDEALAYAGLIIYDENSPFAGSSYPTGTRFEPVNNIADAILLATKYSIHEGHVHSDVHLDRDIENFNFTSSFPDNVFYTNGFKADHCTFDKITIDGEFNNSFVSMTSCIIIRANNIYGSIRDSFLLGTIKITANHNLNMTDSESGIPGAASPIMDFNLGNNVTFSNRGYSGGLTIINCDTPDSIATLSFIDGGKPHLEPSCTDGYISVRGIGYEDDRSSGTTVDYTAWLNPSNISISGSTVDAQEISMAVWDYLTSSGNTNGSFGVLLKDLVTKAEDIQHTGNLNTELLKNKPNNPNNP